jgi:putative addiction module component (TIGR02574 family)
MSLSLEVLQAEVLGLPAADRAKLLDSLIGSLDADAEIEAAWDALADEREQSLRDGSATTISLEEAMSRLRARFPG